MKKLGLFLIIIAVLSSCAKDDTYVDGHISYIAHSNGTEYVADGATVYLMISGSETEYEQKTTADEDGYYKFYPVPDGDYYIYAEYTYLLDDYSGRSDNFTAKGKKDITIDLTLK